MTGVLKPYVSVVEFAAQHHLHTQGYNGILAIKSERHWMLMFPDGETYWNGQLLTSRLVPRIEQGRLLMPQEELEQGFRLAGRPSPELAPPGKAPTGADLFVVGGQEFPLRLKDRDTYTAYPINRLYSGDVFHRDGELITLKAPPIDLRPKVVLRLCQLELTPLAGRMKFEKAEVLIFRNRSWVMLGVLNALNQQGQPFAADYLCVLRVKGHQFQLKVAVAPR